MNQYSEWSTSSLIEEYRNLQRRCWNGEAANVYPLLCDCRDVLKYRGIVPASLIH